MVKPTVAVLHDPDQVVDSLSSFRRQILQALDRPDSATGLAQRLETTRQRVNYHLRALERAGLVELDELRQRRGLTERLMRRTSDVVLVDPFAFDSSTLARQDAVGLGGVVATATDLIRQAAQVAAEAGGRGQRVAAASLDTEIRVSSPSGLRTLLEELADLIARHDSGDEGLQLRVATSILPTLEPR